MGFSGGSEMALNETKDKMDIIELQYRYIHAVDGRKWKDAVGVFHTNAKLYLLDRGKERLFGNTAEIEYFYKGIAEKRYIFSRHHIVNPVVEITGDSAKFKSYYNALYIHEDFTWVIFGTYNDELIKENGIWKLLVKYIDHGWNDFFVPFSKIKLTKEEIKKVKSNLFV